MVPRPHLLFCAHCTLSENVPVSKFRLYLSLGA
uniref:Uncharacterized protein n=1 Tax=Arundo donax TaxID=35708 RepID=A0A0A9H158_ARUDO